MEPLKFRSRDFVHLHLHSDYSLLQSTIQLKPLAATLAELEMKACAMTDLGNMFGAVSFYHQLQSKGIRPIIGYEAFVTPYPLSEGSATHVSAGERAYYNLVLLAADVAGYQNLVRLASIAYTDGFELRPRIDMDLLAGHSEGLIALSGARGSAIRHYLEARDADKAAAWAAQMAEIFGPENFFLEITDHGLPEDRAMVASIVEIGKKTGAPIVASNDVRYLAEVDARAHEVMLAIGEGRTVRPGIEPILGSTKYYLRSADEMWELFGNELPESLDNTLAIAERCRLELRVGGDDLILPHYPIPPDSGCSELGEYFELKVREGLAQRDETLLKPMREQGRLGHEPAEYDARLEREVEVIKGMGYEGYFLIVWDFIKYAVERGIPVGPGRGSAAGSLVAYALGITDIDPLQYDLLFERFLNPERVSMPDIDIDFCIRGRADVIEHVSQLYGRDSVCQIITFGTLASKAAIKDVGRALNMSYAEVERIAKMIPPPIRGRNVSISQALDTVPELKAAVENDPAVRILIDLARRIEGCARHSSVHAAGVVIAPKPLKEIVPVAMSSRNELTSQYSMTDLERVGMLKMDFLALTTLTIIEDCLRDLRQRRGISIDWKELPLDDEKTMELFGEGRTDAVFQFESSGMQEICRKLKPKGLEDLSALNALYRPGPLDGGMVTDFIARHKGEKEVTYLIPEMSEILGNTYGVLVYQEQIMQLAQRLAGYSLGEADMMRRAMGKKKREAMAKEEKKFMSGAIGNGINKKDAEAIFKLMAQFADYGFNRSHSIAYAYLAFQTAYLKAHYPAYFFAAVLSHEADDRAKVYKYSTELRTFGLKLLPPDINESDDTFTPADDSVRFGLNAIKGIGASTVNAVMEARKDGPFTSLFDLAARVGHGSINKRGLESLIYAGALDSIAEDGQTPNQWRARLAASIDDALAFAQNEWNDSRSGQSGLFAASGSEVETGRLRDAEPWSETEMSRNEKTALGFFLTTHPLDEFEKEIERLGVKSLADYGTPEPGSILTLAGIVSAPSIRYTKKGTRYAFFRLDDRSGGLKCVLWPQAFNEFADVVADDALLVVTGRVEGGENSELTLVLNQVRSLSDAALMNARKVVVGLPEGANEDSLLQLFSLFSADLGRCEIELQMPVGSAMVTLKSDGLATAGSRRLDSALKAQGCSVAWM